MADCIIDELIRSKRKTVSLTITKEARLVVRAPLKLPLREIEKLILEKRNWIINKKSLAIERLDKAQDFAVQQGGRFMFLGEPLTLVMSDKVKTVTVNINATASYEGGTILFPSIYQDRVMVLLKKWYKNQAKLFLTKRLDEVSKKTGIPFKTCGITSARRRWGSCSNRNNINLTWRLIMANQQVIDYVLIHELCHVIHKNHSKSFWLKVKEIMPDFAVHRKWLKDNAYILDVFES